MPQPVGGVQITLGSGTPPTTYDVQIGPNGFQGLTLADLFDRTLFDSEHMIGNIRLKKLIGNYGHVESQEFRDALNAGVRLTSGDYYGVSFAPNDDGSYVMMFGTVVNGQANQGMTLDPASLDVDTHDMQMVLRNVGTFLRMAGYTDLTTPAPGGLYQGQTGIQAVAGTTFWF